MSQRHPRRHWLTVPHRKAFICKPSHTAHYLTEVDMHICTLTNTHSNCIAYSIHLPFWMKSVFKFYWNNKFKSTNFSTKRYFNNANIYHGRFFYMCQILWNLKYLYGLGISDINMPIFWNRYHSIWFKHIVVHEELLLIQKFKHKFSFITQNILLRKDTRNNT